MRKVRALFGGGLVLVIILALLVAGCGTKQTASNSGDKVKLTFLCWGSTANMEIRKDVVAEFERTHPHIEIETIHVPLNYEEKLQTMIAGGSAPDVFWLSPTNQMPGFAEKGVLLELDSLMEQDAQFQQEKDNYYEMAYNSGSYKGKQFGLPWIYNPETLYYNKQIFASAGLSVPDADFTLDDVIEVAKKLAKDTTGDGRLDQYGFAANEWIGFVWRFGGSLLDNNDSPTKCTLDQPEAIAGLQFLQDLVYKHNVSPSLATNKALPNEELFLTGKLGMMAGSGYFIPKYKTIKAFDWGTTNMPAGKTKVSVAASTLTVASATTKHPQEAWEFIKFYGGKTAQQICIDAGIATVPVLSMASIPEITEHTQGVFQAAEVGRMMPALANYARIMDKILPKLDYLYMNRYDATKVAQDMTKGVNEVLNQK